MNYLSCISRDLEKKASLSDLCFIGFSDKWCLGHCMRALADVEEGKRPISVLRSCHRAKINIDTIKRLKYSV